MAPHGSGGSSPGDAIREHALTGAFIGAAAYVVSYALTYAFVAIDGVNTEGLTTWKVVGLVFYSAHNVETMATASGGGETISESVNLVSNTFSEAAGVGSSVPEFVYFAAPVAVLLAAGLLAARSIGGRGPPASTGAAVGATVALGYLPLAIAGQLAFEETISVVVAQASYAPDLGTSVLVVGVAYPLVLGALGGAAAGATS